MSLLIANKIKNKFVFSFKSISLLFAQFRVPSLMIWLKQQQFALIVIILYTTYAYTVTIVQ